MGKLLFIRKFFCWSTFHFLFTVVFALFFWFGLLIMARIIWKYKIDHQDNCFEMKSIEGSEVWFAPEVKMILSFYLYSVKLECSALSWR